MRFLLEQAAGLLVLLLVFLNVVATMDASLGGSSTSNKQTTLKDQSGTKFTTFEKARLEHRPFPKLDAGKRAMSPGHLHVRSKNRNSARLSAKLRARKERGKNLQRNEMPHTPQTYFKRSIFHHPPKNINLSPEQHLWYGIPANFDPRASWWMRDYGFANVASDESKFSQRHSLKKKRNMKPACFPFCFPHYSGKRDVFEDKRRVAHNPWGYHRVTNDVHSQLESRANHRPCKRTCVRHRSGNRSTGQVKQPGDTTDVGLSSNHKTDKQILSTTDIFVDEGAPIVKSNLSK